MSQKTLAQKLAIKPGMSLWLSDPGRAELLGPLPVTVSLTDNVEGADAAMLFADSEATIRALLARHGAALPAKTLLWVAYPKGNKADINRDSLWPIMATCGLRPIGQVAIDEVWSALRFRPMNDGEAPFTGGR